MGGSQASPRLTDDSSILPNAVSVCSLARATLPLLGGLLLAGALLSPATATAAANNGRRYLQTDLVADVPGVAPVTDPNLVNPWGLSRSATSAWWVSDAGTGLSTLYSGVGAKLALVVTVPPGAGQPPPNSPTGTVFNGSADFEVGPAQPARFLFATEDGTISGWNPGASPVTAINKVDQPGAIYKGMAIAQIAGANYLYAANFHAGTVEVYDRTFMRVNLGAWAFRDPHVPRDYAPFNVQAIGDKIYVTYAKQDREKIDEIAGLGRGLVSVFSTSGQLSHRLQWGPWMNAPWGVALAPADFGKYSNQILIGQFGSGKIIAFDPANGRFRGYVRNAHNRPLKIDGLWALSFGNGGTAGPLNSLYFTAGTDDETHGLFGVLTAIPKKAHGHDDDETDEE